MTKIPIKIKKNNTNRPQNGFKTLKNGKCCEYCDKGTMHLVRMALKCFR
jgi:hypothetical protein